MASIPPHIQVSEAVNKGIGAAPLSKAASSLAPTLKASSVGANSLAPSLQATRKQPCRRAVRSQQMKAVGPKVGGQKHLKPPHLVAGISRASVPKVHKTFGRTITACNRAVKIRAAALKHWWMHSPDEAGRSATTGKICWSCGNCKRKLQSLGTIITANIVCRGVEKIKKPPCLSKRRQLMRTLGLIHKDKPLRTDIKVEDSIVGFSASKWSCHICEFVVPEGAKYPHNVRADHLKAHGVWQQHKNQMRREHADLYREHHRACLARADVTRQLDFHEFWQTKYRPTCAHNIVPCGTKPFSELYNVTSAPKSGVCKPLQMGRCADCERTHTLKHLRLTRCLVNSDNTNEARTGDSKLIKRSVADARLEFRGMLRANALQKHRLKQSITIRRADHEVRDIEGTFNKYGKEGPS